MMKRTSQSMSYSMGSVGLDGLGALKRWLMVAFILPIARMVVVLRSTEIPFSRCVMKSPSERDFLELAMKSSIGTPPVQTCYCFPIHQYHGCILEVGRGRAGEVGGGVLVNT